MDRLREGLVRMKRKAKPRTQPKAKHTYKVVSVSGRYVAVGPRNTVIGHGYETPEDARREAEALNRGRRTSQ